MKKSFFDKMKNMIIGDEEEYEDEMEDYEYEEEREPEVNRNNITPFNRYSNRKMNPNILNISTNVQIGVCVYNPSTLDEASEVVSKIKDRNIVVINLETVDVDTSQRISDFLCGAAYALEGNIQLISNRIMIITPINVDISGELKDKLQASGIKFSNF